MDYLKIVILFALFASSVAAWTGNAPTLPKSSTPPKPGVKGLLQIWSELTESLTNFANIITSFQNIFSVIDDNSMELSSDDGTTPLDAFLSITELAAKYGYAIEEHEVTTEDGYVLTVHRLRGRNVTAGKVVFLMHGIVDSSDSWVLQGPGSALGYILADGGFDVWMGNARGNKYALAHNRLKADESDFWEFTWEEIGIYDLPAMIDHALNVTATDSLYYVGYSQGTTSFYVMTSMKPEYNDKVKMMFSLAPIAWMSHVKSPMVRMFSPAYKILGYLLMNFNAKSPSIEFFNQIAAVFCSYLPVGCENVLYMIEGYENKNINSTMLPVILGHMPTGASTIQFVHYGQLVSSGRFCRFDFDERRNLKEYGRASPPDYNLTKTTAPIEMFYSDSDWLSDTIDVEILRRKLPNVVGYNFIRGFNHLDYTYASKAKEEVYDRIIFKIQEYENTIG